ncbi:MAG: B12-binding domain-containing radical SAM protein, partial [Candidatus Altiarchaeota archaeon]|nr:B12-binding domain-containing radical SAM protein [Candidatus Altiarchaeota archaeon]
MKKIILIYPGRKTLKPRIPLSLLALSVELEKKGYLTEILDLRNDNWVKHLKDEAYAYCITSMTGDQIKSALKMCKIIKKKHVNAKIIWGGVHSTICPVSTARNRYVDFVVRGEGEKTLIELLDSNFDREIIENIRGITFYESDKLVHNPDRPFLDMDELETPDFNKLKLDKYRSYDAFPYESSRGCPGKCKFCYNNSFNKGGWRSKNPKKVIEELTNLSRMHGVKSFDIVDDNFFADKERVETICKGLIESGFGSKWMASCRINDFISFDAVFLGLLKDSGCDFIRFGAESGSDKTLKALAKDITVTQIKKTSDICSRHKINHGFYFIIGLPDETYEDILKTIDVYDLVESDVEKIERFMALYNPYPGNPLFGKICAKGFEPPEKLEGWGDFNYDFITKQLDKYTLCNVDIVTTIA